jgi:hypothetical protein
LLVDLRLVRDLREKRMCSVCIKTVGTLRANDLFAIAHADRAARGTLKAGEMKDVLDISPGEHGDGDTQIDNTEKIRRSIRWVWYLSDFCDDARVRPEL